MDTLSTQTRLDWVLYRADNQAVITQSWSDINDLELPSTGEYILALRGSGAFNSSVGYTFRIVTPDTNIIELTGFGSQENPNTQTGSISEKGEQDIYTFTGSKGQRLYFDVIDAIAERYGIEATLISPSRKEYFRHSMSEGDVHLRTLEEDGEYRLVIDGVGENTGSYAFNLLDTSLATSINLDTEIEGTLNPGKETHLYQFTATADSRLSFDSLLDVPGTWVLYAPGNQIVAGSGVGLNSYFETEQPLTVTGTYILAIRGASDSAIDYKFKVITPETQSGGLISFDTPVSAQITEEGERDTYTINGTAGLRIFLDTLIENPDVSVTLTSPSGEELINRTLQLDRFYEPIIIPESGTYQLVVDGDRATSESNYSFQLLSSDNAETLTVSATQPTSGTLDPGSSAKLYQISGTKGERIYFDSQIDGSQTNGSGVFILYSPGNKQLITSSTNQDFEYELPSTGTYYLMVRGDGDIPLDYQIQLISTPASPIPVSRNLNDVVTGVAISQLGEQDIYMYNVATVGTRVYFDGRGSNSNIVARLINPSGVEVWSGNTASDGEPITLLETGIYRLIVDGTADATGNYDFRLVNLATSATSLTLGSAVTGNLAARETRFYSINGTLGQSLKFDNLATTANGEWLLYAPGKVFDGGTTVSSASLSQDFEVTLPAGGTYVLALRNNSDISTSFNFRADNLGAATGSNTSLAPTSGTLSAAQVHTRTFNATAGTYIYFDNRDATAGTAARLLFQNSDIPGFNAYNDNLIQLTKTGSYTIRIEGEGSFNYQLINFAVPSSTTQLNFDSTQNNAKTTNFSTGYATQVYRFTATVGQKLFYDALDSNASNATGVQIISPSGDRIFSNFATANSELLPIAETGTYYVVISNNTESIENVSFRLLNASSTNGSALISFSNPISGEFDAAGQGTNLYRFNISNSLANQPFYFNIESGNSSVNSWTLYAPGGSIVTTGNGSFNDFEITPPRAGEYVLAVRGNGEANPYQFRIVPLTQSPVAKNIGDEISGSISLPGEKDIYTINVTNPQQRIYIDGITDSSAGNIKVSLISPSEIEVVDALDVAENHKLFTLDEIGEYRLIVDAKEDYTGDYSLRLIDTSNATPLELSQLTSQTIANNQTVLYQFEATAGKYLYIKSDITAGDKSVWTLYSSGRQVISTNLSFNAENDGKVILPIDGTYILALEGYGVDGTIYELELVEPEVAPAQVIQIGDIIANPDSSLKNIQKPGEKDTYIFTGSIGQNLLFDSIIGTGGLNVEIFSPSGISVYSKDSTIQDAPFTLIEGGEYRIVVSGNGRTVGDYQFRLFDLEQANTIDLNTTSTVTLDRASEARVYKITGSKGQNLYFDLIGDFQTDTGYTGWTLYSSSNQVVKSATSFFGRPDLDVVLPGDGIYTLVFDSSNNDIDTETYNFQVIATEIAVKELTFGETFSGTLQKPGDKHSYTFNGQAGERLFFDSLLGDSAISAKLYSPSSPNDTIRVFSTASDIDKPFFLQETGEYRLIIDGDYETVGDYSFRLVDIEDTEVTEQLKLDTNYNKTIAVQGQIDLYQFQVQKGEKLYFNLQDGDENNVTWSIFGPDNEVFAGMGLVSPDLEVKAEYSGKYVLAVQSKDGSPVSYNFLVSAIAATTKTLKFGETESGNISKPGDQYEYTFTATVGQRIFFDTLADNNQVSIKLISPGNLDIANYSSGNETSAPITLTENGIYRLVVDTSFDATGDYSFRLLDAGQTELTFDEEQSGSLNSRETVLYQITGNVGDRITFNIPSGSWEGLEWTLYGIDGAILGYPGFNSNSLSWMLPATGSYTLAVRNLTTDPDAGAIDYSFDVTKEAPTPVTLAGFGTVQTGVIASGQVATHTFSATAGTRVYFDSLGGDSSGIYFEIIAPDNTVIHSSSMNNDFTIAQLQQSGTYTLRIQGNDATSVGDYKYRLLELPNQTPDPRENENSLELGGQIAKTLNGYETEIFSFTGTVGQKIFYDGIIPSSGAGYIDAVLISPSGKTVFEQNWWNGGFSSDTGLYTLAESGTYNLLALSWQDTPTDVRFRILDPKDAEILQPNRLVAGNLQPGSATNLYKLSGKAEQRLYLDAISGDGISWSLYNSATGQVVAGSSSMTDLEATLPTDGEYILAINGTSSDAVSYSFQVVSFPNTTAIITPGNGESVSVGDSLGSYRVVLETSDGKGGTAEQSFMVRVGPEPGNNAPVIATDAVTDGFANRFYKYNVDANDADGDRLTYTLSEAPSGMLIDSSTGKITWISPVAGVHAVKVRVTDGRGGIETQTFDLNIADGEFGTIRGAVFLDKDGDGKWLVTNPGNLTPDSRVTIGERFEDNYTAYDLGRPNGVGGILGPVAFKRNIDGSIDPDTMLLGGGAARFWGALFEVKVLRGEGGHIIGFDDDDNPETPYGADYFADAPYNDAGLIYTSDGALLANRWPIGGVEIIQPGGIPYATLPVGLGGLTFVPEGFGGAGQLKATGLWPGNAFYTVNYSPDGTFEDGSPRYKIDSLEEETNAGFGPGAFIYVPASKPNFENGNSLVMAEWNVGEIAAYEVDSQGNPIATTREVLVDDYFGAWGGVVDPVTGDMLFSAWNGNDNVMVVRGLGKPGENEVGLKDWLVFVDADLDGVRDAGEKFTYTDAQGKYSFDLAPGTYRIVQESQPGWTQTKPTNPKYWDVTIVDNDTKFGIDFGNTNSRLAGENVAPEFISEPPLPTEVVSNEKFSYRVRATDLNADDLTYDLVLKPSGMAIAANGTITWRPGDEHVGKHQVIARVSDGRGGVDLQPFEVEVKQGNRAPVFTSVTSSILNPQANRLFQFQATALDLDGDTIIYEIIPNEAKPITPTTATIDGTTGLISWTPTDSEVGGAFNWAYSDTAEPWEILVKATDGKGGEAFQTIKMLVNPDAPNRAPEILSKPRTSIQLGNNYFYQINAVDPDNDALTYTLDTAPTGMVINNGVLVWTPTAEQFGANDVVVRVSDGTVAALQSFRINVGSGGVSGEPLNRAPEITSTPEQITNLEREYQYNLVGSDRDGDLLLWSLDEAPAGMVIDPQTGALRWKPRADQLGAHTVKVRLTDGLGAFVGQEFTLLVNGTNIPPQISSTPGTIAGVDQPYSYQVIAIDPEGEEISYSLGKAPVGMTISKDGVISWTPNSSQLQAFQVEVIASDRAGASAVQSYTLEVARETQNGEVVSVDVNNAPTITSTPTYLTRTNSAYSYQVGC